MSPWKRLVARVFVAILIVAPLTVSAATAVVSRPRFDDLLAAIGSSTNVQIACDGKITFAFPIAVSSTLTIDASGHNIVFDGRNLCQFFTIDSSGSLTLKSVTLTNGYTVGNGAAIAVDGGVLTLHGCTFTHNRAVGAPSVVYYVQSGQFDDGPRYTDPGPAFGGAIWAVSALLNIVNCTFESNTASAWPVAAATEHGTVGGGAICAISGSMTVINSVFRSNSLISGYTTPPSVAVSAKGGAICGTNCNVQLVGSIFVSNIIATAFDASYEGGGALAADVGSLTIDQTSFTSNSIANHSGGAVLLTGAISPCIIGRSMFANNSATNEGGGAISHTAPVQIVQTAFINNRVRGRDAYLYSNSGGSGIIPATQVHGGAISSLARLDATNCVFYANVARSGDGYPDSGTAPNGLSAPSSGGALYVSGSGEVHLTHCSFAANAIELGARPNMALPVVGSALLITNAPYSTKIGTLELQGSLLSGPAPLIQGFVSDAGFNVTSDSSGGFTNVTSLTNKESLLEYFTNQIFSVVRPGPGSPAINWVTAPLADIDIRGALRGPLPHDAGAVELDGTTILSAAVSADVVTLKALAYLEPLTILVSEDFKSWTQAGMAFPRDGISTLAITNSTPYGFYRAELAP